MLSVLASRRPACPVNTITFHYFCSVTNYGIWGMMMLTTHIHDVDDYRDRISGEEISTWPELKHISMVMIFHNEFHAY